MIISKYTPRPDRRPAVALILALTAVFFAGVMPSAGGDGWRAWRLAVSAAAALAALMTAARFAVYSVSYTVRMGERGAELIITDERRGRVTDAVDIGGGEIKPYSKKLARELSHSGIMIADRRVDLIPAESALFIPRTAIDAARGLTDNAVREERAALRFQPSAEQTDIISRLCGNDTGAASAAVLSR